jgi:glucose-6-phosphate isomerase
MLSAHDLLTRWPALDVTERRARLHSSLHLWPGVLAGTLDSAAVVAERAAAALWRYDASAWTTDPAVQQELAKWFGWMASPALMADAIERLHACAARVKSDGIQHVVLLGMGGSSLAPEVIHAILGAVPGWPRFQMLDSTDPEAVRAAGTPPRETLYLVSSKSGTTIEPNVLMAHFRQRAQDAGVARWGDHFIAITDDGTELARRAKADGFRDLFINPSDIGGRYSALSFFGMVPAALMGHDVGEIVGWGLAMLAAAHPSAAAAKDNPATGLGLMIGEGARSGRDKLTLVVPDALDAFGLWVEQLVAESTGKQGTGIVPIAGEPLADPKRYGTDRLFVRVRAHGAHDEAARDEAIRALTSAQVPVVEIDTPEKTALGAEFVRWEIATAVAGAILQINPFDQPNVQQAKDATNVLLAGYSSSGALPIPAPDRTLDNGVTMTLSAAARTQLKGAGPDALLTLLRGGDYFALLAYLDHDPEYLRELQTLRRGVRDRSRAATMFGYGPRYLHSTGQLHKGGPNTGVFLLISAAPREDLAIPEKPFSFGTLEQAQALGDFKSLDAAGRRALHAHLPRPDANTIAALSELLLRQPA